MNLFLEFDKKSDKYDEDENINIWHRYNNDDDFSTITLGTLHKYFKDSIEELKNNNEDGKYNDKIIVMDRVLNEKFWILENFDNFNILKGISNLKNVFHREIDSKYMTLIGSTL